MNDNKNKAPWLWILLCLPMVFIVYFAITLSGNNIDPADVSVVKVTTPSGQSFDFKDGDGIPFYVNMYLEADPLNAPVRDIEDEKPMSVTIKQKNTETAFELYAEVNTNGCFFRNDKGKYFSIPTGFAKKLLQREECAYVYGNAGYTLPGLSFVTGEETRPVLPEEYSWQYKNIAGVSVMDTTTAKADTSQFYSFYSDKKFTLKFDQQPQQYTIMFYDKNGTALDAAAPDQLIFSADTELHAVVEASWAQGENTLGGTAKYSFDLLYDVLPEILVNNSTVTAGDVLNISFRNLSESEAITLNTQLITSKIKVLYSEGGTAFALLPIDLANTAGVYDLNFTVGDMQKTVSLTVQEKSATFNNDSMHTEKYIKYLLTEFKTRYDGLLAQWCQSAAQPAISNGSAFQKPVSTAPKYDFGSDLLINGTPDSYLVQGIEYCTEVGSTIKATHNGVVAYVGNDEVLGNILVVDHGYGVLSHYYGVGNLNKKQGDKVTKGEEIGKAGISGLTYTAEGKELPTLHFSISVDGVFVNPNGLFSSGLYIPE